jgi:membrane protease YdiL (CAAX protease family)
MTSSLEVQAPASTEPQVRFRQRFWPLFLLGLLGVATLPLVLVPMIRAGALPEGVPDLPLPALVALSMINPVLYLAGMTALGAWLAPKLGLRSLVAARPSAGTPLRPQLHTAAPIAVAIGLALSALTILLDAAFQPFLSPEWTEAAAEMPEPGGLAALVSGLLYGGIAEEIMLRWGVLSFFAWAAWRLFQRGKGVPSRAAMWTSIVLAALLFGAGHLPAAAALAPLDSVLVLRVISLNALGGLFFGWLFWRYHLEAAMLAHASAHMGFALLAWSGLA